MNLFESNKKMTDKQEFEQCIEDLTVMNNYCKKTVRANPCAAPEIGLPVFFFGTRPSLIRSIKAHEERIYVLKKMKQDKVITNEEHHLLLNALFKIKGNNN